MPKLAIVLFQLGGPDSLESVEPFLRNLFLDPDIIDFPGAFLARGLLARIIASRRAAPVAKHYQEIGGKSPINELTNLQARALEQALQQNGIDATVFVAMRYWHPTTEEVVRQIKAGSFQEIILLPLYPHFSKATTYSSMNEWNRQSTRAGLALPSRLVCCYPNHPRYIEALVDRISLALSRFQGVDAGEIDLVFSAHGVPMDFIRNGDPYKLQIEETVRQVMKKGAWTSPHLLCYQSRVGPARWLEPSLLNSIDQLAERGRRNLLVIPMAFVTEHIETLHEINIEAREEAVHKGITRFEMMPALNDHPRFIKCLAELVNARLQSGYSPASKCKRLQTTHGSQEPEPVLCPWYPTKN
jgi:protoporphyrin/coproporphyrin ferrochelatase